MLYGRRRVGKTELLQRLCSGEHRAVYFLAAQVREKDNLRAFREALKEGLGGDALLDGIEFPDWSPPWASPPSAPAASADPRPRRVPLPLRFEQGLPSQIQQFWDLRGRTRA